MTTSIAEQTAVRAVSRYWEDIAVGETSRSSERVVTAEEMVEFAAKYDPQSFHVDRAAANKSLFGGLIGSGIYSAALWRIMDHEVNGNIAFVCGIAWDNVKWGNALRPGDTIYATSRCLTKRESKSRSGVGIITMHHEVINQKDEAILAFDGVDLVYRKSKA
jgi:acyl dehydratase